MNATEALRKILRALTSLNGLDDRERRRVLLYLISELEDMNDPTNDEGR